MFSAAPILSPDEKISRLKKDIGNIINILKTEEEEKKMEMGKMDVIKTVRIEVGKNDNQESDTLMDNSIEISNVSDKDSKTTFESKFENQRSLEGQTSLNEEQCDDEDNGKVKDYNKSIENLEGLVIVTQLVTSCIRGLHHSQSKLQSLEILLELAENTSDETILDRILPYIVSF